MTLRELIKSDISFAAKVEIYLLDICLEGDNTGEWVETECLFKGHSNKIANADFLDYTIRKIWIFDGRMCVHVVRDGRPLDPFFTNTVTMKSFDYGYAWENRFNIPVNSGDLLLVDGKRKFQIVDIIMPPEFQRVDRCPWYKLKPVEDTLEDMKREYDEVARKNYGMIVGKYPDFGFDVESNWFFARDVRW